MRPQTTVKILQWTLLAVLLAQHLLAYRVLNGLEDTSAVWSLNNALDPFIESFPLLDGLFFAQVALLMMWAHLGPGRWYLRWPLIGSLAWWLSCVASEQFNSAWTSTLKDRAMQVLTCQMAILFVGLIAMQASRFRLSDKESLESSAKRYQFSLRSLLMTMLVTGVVVRAGQLANGHLFKPPTLSDLLAVTSVAIPLSLAPLMSIWATLRPGKYWWRLLVIAAVAPAIGVLGPVMCGHLEEWSGFVMWTGIETAIVAASLLIVRASGYRLVRVTFRGASTTNFIAEPLPVAGA